MTAHSFYDLLAAMTDARRTFAAEHDLAVTDDEIAASIRSALVSLMETNRPVTGATERREA